MVVHSAAATNWRADPDEIRRTNVDGTRAMLDLAAAAGAAIYYMSTAFVAANPSAPRTLSAVSRRRLVSGVQEECEQMVRDSALPATILRPSVVMGDSATGRIAGAQGLTRTLGAIVKGQVPVLPGAPEARIDTVPQDLVARATGDLIRSGVTAARTG